MKCVSCNKIYHWLSHFKIKTYERHEGLIVKKYSWKPINWKTLQV